MMEVPVEKCRSCGAEIIFARGKSGRVNPVNAEPVMPKSRVPGNLVLVFEGRGMPVAIHADPTTPTLDDDGVRYLSHFATCPDAKDWRRT